MTLTADEFLRRFLGHVLPKGFVRIRFSGFLANRRRAALLPICCQLLAAQPRSSSACPASPDPPSSWSCPRCGGPMVIIERLSAKQLGLCALDLRSFVDTSRAPSDLGLEACLSTHSRSVPAP
jgi:hypothetical protein